MQLQLKSPETLNNLKTGVANNEAAAQERSGNATQLAGEAQQFDREAKQIREELEQVARRQRELEAEADRLEGLAQEKETLAQRKQAESESQQDAALAAIAQADDLRAFLALVMPNPLTTGQPPATTTGPQDMRVAGTPETAANFPAAQSTPGGPAAATKKNR